MGYSASLFCQILQIIPRAKFEQLVRETGAEAKAKGFKSWTQCVAMLFCQLALAHSLREIRHGLASSCGKLNHLGLTKAPSKSTLSYANEHRPYELWRRLFFELLDQCQAHAPGKKKKFRFKNKLYSIDATTIDLCLNLFPWADFRQTKGAVKLHLLLDHDGYLPVFAHVTEAKVHEVKTLPLLALPKGSIVAMDRGYQDFAIFERWTQQGVFFVTRLKSSNAYRVVERRDVPQRGNVLADEIITFSGWLSHKKCPRPMRRIVVWDAVNEKPVALLTNHLDFGATTIAQIYRDRWEIELFFKLLKQQLRIKSFVGTSANALQTQIWTALIVVLLLKYMQFCSRCALPVCTLLALLRWNLFTYRELWAWLDDPFAVPPEPPPIQLALPFGTASPPDDETPSPTGGWFRRN